ncbi:hypothetical protein GGR89_000897 [Sphingomonas trueperi]|uniref:Uncharacterized protein n=1 Tax=Sphingomonas trueperi TaxID=53317 RepID=A0A7X5XWX1_9SPHN|nr:hypothetical protein [Sphingomonas trueperi]
MGWDDPVKGGNPIMLSFLPLEGEDSGAWRFSA